MRWTDAHICDVLVIGAGLAGERVAIEAAMEGHQATILSLVPPRRSHSTAAQGGMQASLGNVAMGYGDNTDIHFADTVKGSDWGCEQDVARLFAETAPVAVRQMAAWGVPWSRVIPGKRTLPDGVEVEELPGKGRSHRPAPVRRHRQMAHLLRGGRHRPRAPVCGGLRGGETRGHGARPHGGHQPYP
jgi:succinate dehydrogenase/fumarate reductase flavoprotein subunit